MYQRVVSFRSRLTLPINCCIMFHVSIRISWRSFAKFSIFRLMQSKWLNKTKETKKPAAVYWAHGAQNLLFNNRDLVWWCMLFDVAARANVERVPSHHIKCVQSMQHRVQSNDECFGVELNAVCTHSAHIAVRTWWREQARDNRDAPCNNEYANVWWSVARAPNLFMQFFCSFAYGCLGCTIRAAHRAHVERR